MTDLDMLLQLQSYELEQFLKLYTIPGFDPELMVNHAWNSRDLLAHIVAWHESFAKNLELLAASEPPEPPRGTLKEVNRKGVADLAGLDIRQLTRRARRAQRVIEQHIHNVNIEIIPYRKPGTSYTRSEHLDVVRGHIRNHFWQLLEKQLGD